MDLLNRPGRPRRSFRVAVEDDQRALSDFLARRCPEAPVGFLNRLLRKGFVHVDGCPASSRVRLRPGQRVVLRLPEEAFLVAPNPRVRFAVVHEDACLVVVDKPVRWANPTRETAPRCNRVRKMACRLWALTLLMLLPAKVERGFKSLHPAS